MIPTYKIKGEEHDFYQCRECGKVWKSYYKKIGHKKCPK
jgi:uncharacterized Zn finger protein